MLNSQFAYDENLLLPDAFTAFQEHFQNIDDFKAEYQNIPEAKKERFLRLASTYKFLVKTGEFLSVKETSHMQISNYYDLTYKFIALISIIEATAGKDEWLDFYEWLKKKNIIKIKGDQELDNLHKQYKTEYGAIRSFIKFFEILDAGEKDFLKGKIIQYRIDKGKAVKYSSEIKDLAKLLYDIRSDFVHNARLIVEFDGIPSLTANRRKNRPFISKLALSDLLRIFERCFIKHFGMKPSGTLFL